MTVSNAIIAELGVLRNNYTMTIPHGVQVQNFCNDKNKGSSNKLFGVTYDGNRSYDISCMDRGVKEDVEDGWKVDVANAVKDKDLLWVQYLETMTSLKESPSKEPNTISYTATLDLGVFCKYGRKVDELITQ